MFLGEITFFNESEVKLLSKELSKGSVRNKIEKYHPNESLSYVGMKDDQAAFHKLNIL